MSDKCDAMILIPSTVGEVERRAAIRESWLNDLYSHYDGRDFRLKHMFVFGKAKGLADKGVAGRGSPGAIDTATATAMEADLSLEMEEFGDILVFPFVDNYSNLTVKVGLMIKWAAAQDCKLVFKIDSDVFIYSHKFVDLIEKIPSSGPVYGGHSDSFL